MEHLPDEERAIVQLVRSWVDHEVKPVVQTLEHANTYPEQLIDEMKEMGTFGLAVPEPWGDAQVSTPCSNSRRPWASSVSRWVPSTSASTSTPWRRTARCCSRAPGWCSPAARPVSPRPSTG